ncbi:hypothetical protein [Nocardiopsis sp. CC223A]|uniref:hypothetical protein n=1 Tax=Nocardiopsis sp. CC223A TaxID=3044051 RepID=UPI00278C3537|nr:hypothetical protein [Nocardiopsis sp. CC223A]
MHQFSATLLGAAFALLRALFTAPSGRHHRRRASRVRRYADPRPATRPLPPAAPRLSAPREVFPADDLPLVRPYYTAHEQSRRQAAATARLRQWTAPRIPEPRPYEGDLLAPAPATFEDLARATRVWLAQQEKKQAAGVGA